jgi:hypothetical protein
MDGAWNKGSEPSLKSQFGARLRANAGEGRPVKKLRLVLLLAILVFVFIVVEAAVAASRGGGGGGGARGGGPRPGGTAGRGFHNPHRFHGSHSHFRGSFFFGGVFAPWYYPYGPFYYPPPPYYAAPPYYYYPPPAYYAPPPYDSGAQVYSTPPLTPGLSEPPAFWWHYCAPLQAYYPYVTSCPEEWQRVAPQPPPAASAESPGQSD